MPTGLPFGVYWRAEPTRDTSSAEILDETLRESDDNDELTAAAGNDSLAADVPMTSQRRQRHASSTAAPGQRPPLRQRKANELRQRWRRQRRLSGGTGNDAARGKTKATNSLLGVRPTTSSSAACRMMISMAATGPTRFMASRQMTILATRMK